MNIANSKYVPATVEAKWQKAWAEANAFQADVEPGKKHYYVLEMLPYPSGVLHMGHVRNYTLGDVLARYKRAQGFNVMHPMGWDSFGLPAENAAIKRKTHPKEWTLANIADMKKVMNAFGWSYDWSKEITSCLPSYYGPQQSLFIDMYNKGLVYRGEAFANWDPVDQTVLANEQVVDGKGWRSGAVVERRKMPQWFFKITHYADQLLADLDTLPDWPERVKTMQENWIGKSTGVTAHWKLDGTDGELELYTTHPETFYACTFCAVAPEHPLALQAAQNDDKLRSFLHEASSLGTAQETIDKAEKKGYKLPYSAIHPFTGQKLPLYAANFVLSTYGSGAIMAAPAHDQRDYDFAKKYNLPIISVIEHANANLEKEAYVGFVGTMVNSGEFNGLSVAEAREKMALAAEKAGWGQRKTQWRLRDWGLGRQRYWGCPIPFIHCEKCGVVPVPKDQLPVQLPEDVELTGSGNPLDRHPTWKHTTCPTCGGKAVRETDTMDTFVDSSWYFFRYLCPTLAQPLDKATVDYWAPHGVDQYIGGIEHAVLHLLYARFFTKALRDLGHVTTAEPFKALLCQGMLIGNAYQKADGTYLYPSQVELKGGKAFEKSTGEQVTIHPAEKISKSKNNGDSPDDLIARVGADALRLFILFAAPPERDVEWSESAIEGASRFLNRVWALTERAAAAPKEGAQNRDIQRKIHQTIAKVTRDIENFQYNTMVAACMELLNELQKAEGPLLVEGTEALIRLLNPAVPHITEELWSMLGHKTPLCFEQWPQADAELAKASEITLVVQVDGKVRAKLTVAADIAEAAALEQAKAAPEVLPWLQNRQIAKQVYVPGRLVNIVTSQ
ncbi:MAG TPA: leucine--tRNA ligase [Alphaproteobacteria bacterium]|nr:leucine--tRNA ligase [Alphaproteobacteria bacterium]